eukprot:scaffold825_cov249-Pinguiococcus_pyrenoidosus.AAC.34
MAKSREKRNGSSWSSSIHCFGTQPARANENQTTNVRSAMKRMAGALRSDLRGPDKQRPVLVDRAAKHGEALPLPLRHGFPGDCALVDVAGPFLHHAIAWQPRPRRNSDEVASLQIRDLDLGLLTGCGVDPKDASRLK